MNVRVAAGSAQRFDAHRVAFGAAEVAVGLNGDTVAGGVSIQAFIWRNAGESMARGGLSTQCKTCCRLAGLWAELERSGRMQGRRSSAGRFSNELWPGDKRWSCTRFGNL